MFDKLLPRRIDDTYRAHKLALWLFAVPVAVKILQSPLIIFNGSSIARSADGLPLDTITPAAAQTVVALLVLDYLARPMILYFVPPVSAGQPPGPSVNLMVFVLLIVGLAPSLWSQGNPKAQQQPSCAIALTVPPNPGLQRTRRARR